ncbi:MAG: DUF2203 domain-containing protein [Chloroflexi bacterium]|nr:DUF2203 domain-containing protein [Chloroflexota bacterium]
MTRYYDIDAANAALPDVERILLGLRDQREELIRLRDQVVAGREAAPNDPPGPAAVPIADSRTLRLRMQFLIDQMQAGVTRLVERDVTLREIEAGLIDFPALASGRQIWLCWRLGEEHVEYWHEMDDGFAGRRLLADLT